MSRAVLEAFCRETNRQFKIEPDGLWITEPDGTRNEFTTVSRAIRALRTFTPESLADWHSLLDRHRGRSREWFMVTTGKSREFLKGLELGLGTKLRKGSLTDQVKLKRSVVQLYRDELFDVKRIATELGISEYRVRTALKELGVRTRRSKTQRRINRMLDEGHSAYEIHVLLGV